MYDKKLNCTKKIKLLEEIFAEKYLPSLPRTAARSKLLNADGSNVDKVIITYLNSLLPYP